MAFLHDCEIKSGRGKPGYEASSNSPHFSTLCSTWEGGREEGGGGGMRGEGGREGGKKVNSRCRRWLAVG